jgi:hypothetical protein
MNYLVILLLWLATLGLAGGIGWGLRGDHEAARDLDAVSVAIEQKDAAQSAVDQLDGAQATEQAARTVKDRIITREVIRYVEITPPESRCALPGSWRVQHDAAATGEPATDPAGLAAGAADSVTDAAALETVAENYSRCRAAIEQVRGWQQWWQRIGKEPGGPAMSSPFDVLRDTLLSSALAENISIAGQPRRALVDRAAVVLGDYGQVIGQRVEIEIPSEAASLGETVTIGVQTYVLDAQVSDDGLFARWVVRAA